MVRNTLIPSVLVEFGSFTTETSNGMMNVKMYNKPCHTIQSPPLIASLKLINIPTKNSLLFSWPTIDFYPWISMDFLQFAIRVKMVDIGR